MAELVAEGACEAGLAEGRIHVFNDHDSLTRSLRLGITKGDRILVKGSRAAGMERIIAALEKESH